LQGALESLHVPYTGSGVLGSALSMDKTRSKRVWQSLGLSTPTFAALPRGADVLAAARRIGYPLIVKPACEGSSVGVTRVFAEQDLAAAVELAERYPGDLLMETLIEGDELTVAILGRQVLPSIHIVPKGAFYDYNAKYVAEDTQYICPGAEGAAADELAVLSLAAFDALGCAGWGRVDVMRDRNGRPWLLEVNTAPGMTSHSLVPKAAAAAGIDYQELCWRVLETSFQREWGIGNRNIKQQTPALPIPHSLFPIPATPKETQSERPHPPRCLVPGDRARRVAGRRVAARVVCRRSLAGDPADRAGGVQARHCCRDPHGGAAATGQGFLRAGSRCGAEGCRRVAVGGVGGGAQALARYLATAHLRAPAVRALE